MPSVDSAQALQDLMELFREARRTSHDPDALDEETARSLLREMRGADDPDDVDGVLERANELLEGHGVEALRDEEGGWVDSYYGDISFLYVNMGDPYIQTIGYDTEKSEFVVAGWGDWLEEYEQRREKTEAEGRADAEYGAATEREEEFDDDER